MLYYRAVDKGHKEWILCLHCIGSTNIVFMPQQKKLSKEYNILFVDLPGHGRSTEYEEDFTFESIVGNIVEIMDILKIVRINILSLSIGSTIGMYMIYLVPEKINKALLIGGATDFSLKVLKYLFYIFVKLKKILPKKIYLYFVTKIIVPLKKDKKNWKALFKYCLKLNKVCLYRWFDLCSVALISSNDLKAKVINSEVRQLYVSGEKDYVFIYSLYRDISMDGNIKMLVMKGCGHLCNLDDPDQFNEIAMDFFKK